MSEHVLAMFGLPGGTELIFLGFIALLLFGRRLPDVARSVGKSIVEFKRGMRDIKGQIDDAASHDSEPPRRIEHKQDANGGGPARETPEAKHPEESESNTPR
jgi:sec-independent protein translocase protein TatA